MTKQDKTTPKTTNTTTTTMQGRMAEELACAYLQAQGLSLLQRNYRLRSGEIDLILRDGDDIVFVEVRYRQNQTFGGAVGSVNTRKQQKLIKTALHYLTYHAPEANARFDVIAMSASSVKPRRGANQPTDQAQTVDHNSLEWIKNAFSTDLLY